MRRRGPYEEYRRQARRAIVLVAVFWGKVDALGLTLSSTDLDLVDHCRQGHRLLPVALIMAFVVQAACRRL